MSDVHGEDYQRRMQIQQVSLTWKKKEKERLME